MFKTFVLTLLSLAFLSSASAAQAKNGKHANPCAPTFPAVTTPLNCSEDGVFYSIKLHVLMSDPHQACSGEDYQEKVTATIQVIQADGEKQTLEATQGVSYELGAPGMSNASFRSTKPQLELDRCITPVFGGMSVGN